MPEPFNSQLIGGIEIALALLVFHRALPAVLVFGRLQVLKFWLLGFALGSFGIGRAFGPPYLAADAWIFTVGHYCLIAYVVMRLRQLMLASDSTWWRQP